MENIQQLASKQIDRHIGRPFLGFFIKFVLILIVLTHEKSTILINESKHKDHPNALGYIELEVMRNM